MTRPPPRRPQITELRFMVLKSPGEMYSKNTGIRLPCFCLKSGDDPFQGAPCLKGTRTHVQSREHPPSSALPSSHILVCPFHFFQTHFCIFFLRLFILGRERANTAGRGRRRGDVDSGPLLCTPGPFVGTHVRPKRSGDVEARLTAARPLAS